MKRMLWPIIIVLLIVGGAAAAYFGGFLGPRMGDDVAAAPTTGTTTTGTTTAGTTVAPSSQGGDTGPTIQLGRRIADARVVPARSATLSLPVTGFIAEVPVAEGDLVAAGDLILRLDDAQPRTAVSGAQAQLQHAQARLAELKAGPRVQEIDAARAALVSAQAALMRVERGSGPGDQAAAQAAVDAAQARLQKVREGAGDQELIAAQADMANAEAELQRAQRAFNEVKWRNDVGALPQAAALQTATNNYAAAQARYADLAAGPSGADVAAAQADVRQAQARLDALEETLPTDVASAQAEVQRAQAQLDLLEAGTRPEVIAAAEADVAVAIAALQNALVALADTELRAPFDGTIAALDREPGEQVVAGTEVARLAQLDSWEIRTEDLTEFQVVGITPGTRALLTFDAIPDLVLDGTVERVRPIGEDRRGDIVYTVIVRPDGNDPRILWNMTAVTEFAAP